MTKYINCFIKTSFIFFLSLAFFVAMPVFAAEIRLEANKVEVKTGEQFVVTTLLSVDKPVNAIEGQLIFPQDLLSVKEIRDGNSVINFWIDPVRNCISNGVEKPDAICFSGITPGGFSGVNNHLFSVVFEAKNTGIAFVAFQNTKVFKNDGLGTETVFRTRDTAVSIKPGDSNTRKETLIDTELPEDFNPTVENDPNIFDGKYFIVFASQDKISGIKRYEVREGEWGWFNVAESPYLLKHQSLNRKIFVKAIDRVGNERIAVLNAEQPAPWYRYYLIFGILLVIVLVGFLLKKLWSKFTK